MRKNYIRSIFVFTVVAFLFAPTASAYFKPAETREWRLFKTAVVQPTSPRGWPTWVGRIGVPSLPNTLVTTGGTAEDLGWPNWIGRLLRMQ